MKDLYELVEDGVKVTFEYIGEGWEGDYDKNDPEDEQLLRFNVFAHVSLKNPHAEDSAIEDDFGYMLDSSYCTQLPLNTPETIIRKALKSIMVEVKDAVIGGHSIKQICATLSWISPNDFAVKNMGLPI